MINTQTLLDKCKHRKHTIYCSDCSNSHHRKESTDTREFTPRLGQGELPTLDTTITESDFHEGVNIWNSLMSDYDGMLYAKVEGERDHLYATTLSDQWRYFANSQRYRNKEGLTIATNSRRWIALRDGFVDACLPISDTLANSMMDREITLHRWLKDYAKQLKYIHCAQWMLGSGGFNTISTSSIVSLESTLRKQYDYLINFAEDMIERNRDNRNQPVEHISLYTPKPMQRKGLVNRSQLYVESTRASGERGRATSYRTLAERLPAYPADGSTICQARCKCHWRFNNRTGDLSYFLAYWRLNPFAKHCATCITYSFLWSPLRVYRF